MQMRKRYLAPLFLLIFFSLFYWLFRQQGLDFTDLLYLNRFGIFAWVALTVLTWWINGVKMTTLLDHMEHPISVWESFQLSAASSVLNYLPFQAGATARGAYLKKRYGFPAHRYVSMLLGIYTAMIFTQAAVGGIIWLTLPHHTPASRTLGIILLLGMTSTLLIAFLPAPRLPRVLQQTHEAFQDIFRDRRCWQRLIALEVFLFAVESTRLVLAFRLLGFHQPLPWQAYGLMSCLTLATVLVNLTPAGLGIRESAVALVAQAFGFSAQRAFLAASFDRVLTLVVIFTLGPLLTWTLLRKLTAPTPNQTTPP